MACSESELISKAMYPFRYFGGNSWTGHQPTAKHLLTQGEAEKRAVIKERWLIQTLYLQNYKNIILKYTSKLITFWRWPPPLSKLSSNLERIKQFPVSIPHPVYGSTAENYGKKFMSSARFEPTIWAFEKSKIARALNCVTTGVGPLKILRIYTVYILIILSPLRPILIALCA
jgi:hypothetical protein